MYSLYFSISSSVIFLAIFEDDKLLSSINENNFRSHSENFIIKISSLLKICSLDLSMIDFVYFTSIPSSQTGIRISLSFIAILKVLNPEIKVYHIDTLLFQACGETCISTLCPSFNRDSNNTYFSIFINGNLICSGEKVNSYKIEKLKKKFSIIKEKNDLKGLDFLDSFWKMKSLFKELNDVGEITY